MWYGNTKRLLESIVRGLETEPPQSDAEWQAQTDLVHACLAEMVEMSEPTVNPAKGATSRYAHRPVADKLNRAMPHVRSMLTAMRDRDRSPPWRTVRRPFGGSEPDHAALVFSARVASNSRTAFNSS
jgi:hypothetical protein